MLFKLGSDGSGHARVQLLDGFFYCDFVGWHGLGVVTNHLFGIFGDLEWKSGLFSSHNVSVIVEQDQFILCGEFLVLSDEGMQVFQPIKPILGSHFVCFLVNLFPLNSVVLRERSESFWADFHIGFDVRSQPISPFDFSLVQRLCFEVEIEWNVGS